MNKILIVLGLFAIAFAGCGGGGSSPGTAPTTAPSPLIMTYVNIPYQPTPYPTTASQVFFPFTGSAFAVTVQANGGTPAYNFSVGSVCGTAGASSASIARVGTNQFTITPTVAGGACPLTFTDSSVPPQSFVVTIFVNGGGSSGG